MNAIVNIKDIIKNSPVIRTGYLSPRLRTTLMAADEQALLARKYSKFDRHQQIYETAMEALKGVGRALSSQELSADNGYNSKPYYTNKAQQFLQEIARPTNPLGTYMGLEDKFVETRLSAGSLNIQLRYGDNNRLKRSEDILKKYFTQFDMPRTFKVADQDVQGNINKFNLGAPIESVLTAEALSSIVADFTPPNGTETDKEKNRFKLPKGWKDSPFSKTVAIRLKLHLDKATLLDEYGIRVNPTRTGELLSGNFRAQFPVSIELSFRWPWEFALYATCANDRKDFVPFLFFQYVNWHRIAYAGKRTRGNGLAINPPARVNHLENVIAANNVELKNGRVIRPRMNEDGFVIVGTGQPSMLGQVIWVDKNANRVPEYMDQIRSSYDNQNKVIDLTKLKIKATGLLYDPFNEKWCYIRESGSDKSASDVSGLQTIDLTGSVALDATTIAIKLNTAVRSEPAVLKDFMVIIKKFLKGSYPGITASKEYTSSDVLKTYGFDSLDASRGEDIYGECERDIAESPDVDFTWGTFGGRLLKMSMPDADDAVEGTPLAERYTRIKRMRAFANVIKDISADILKNIDKLDVAFSAKVERWRYILTIITKYSKDDIEYQKVLNTNTSKNTARKFSVEQMLDTSRLNFANLPGLTEILPHQSETSQDLKDRPSMGFLESDVGLGKCQDYNELVPTDKGMMKIGELYDNAGEYQVNGFREADIKVHFNGKTYTADQMYRTKGKFVKTRTSHGDEFKTLKEHKFWTLHNGRIDFKQVGDLQVGDWLPKKIGLNIYSKKSPKNMTPALARILGFLTSEGYMAKSFVSFTNSDPDAVILYKNDWMTTFGRDNLRESTGSSNSISYYSTKEESDYLYGFGLIQKTSAHQEVPAAIRQSTKEIQVEYLKTLFEGDGTIYFNINKKGFKVPVLEYDSISSQLVKQVKQMLENMGIYSTVYYKTKYAANTVEKRKVSAYNLYISQKGIKEFSKQIGFACSKKQEVLQDCVQHLSTVNKKNTVFGPENQYPVAKQVRVIINELESIIKNHTFVTEQGANRGYSLTRLYAEIFNWEKLPKSVKQGKTRDIHNSLTVKGKDVVNTHSLDMLEIIVKNLDNKIKKQLHSNVAVKNAFALIKQAREFVWTKVVRKVYESTKHYAYDLVVPGPHAYVSNGFMSHNTVMGLTDAVDLIQTKSIKRALIAAPGHLVRNWANEIRKFSKGELNVFIITIQTVRRLQMVYKGITDPAAKPSYVFLKQIIEAMPPNTVFLTNLRFFIIDREEIVYGNTIIERFYSAEFLREMQFDAVFIDESHKVKSLAASQSKGAAIVTTSAKFVRLLSGTTVNNTLVDLVGQSALGAPAALGNEKNFKSKYGASYGGDDEEEFSGDFRPDAASKITQDMRPYAKRMIHKRERIAGMLPEALEDFHQVAMTPMQKQFYDALVTTKFEELQEKNPKLFAKMLDANEKEADKLSAGLATHFQACEQFLCAPDSIEEFVDLDGVTAEDLVSPKVRKVVEILDQHFMGTLNNEGSFDTEPEPYKVIIFGSRRVTSEHVFKHLPEKYKRQAVWYNVDNKQSLEIFEKSDKIRILVADGASITEGLSLTMASRMIRMETVWAPGDLIQAFARVYRPAFTGPGATRKKVSLDWIVCGGSLDIAKVGRIISKIVEKAKFDRQEDVTFVFNNFAPSPGYMQMKVGNNRMIDIIPQAKSFMPIAEMMESLPLIKMSKQTLIDLQEIDQLEKYFATYALFNDYEKQELERAKKEGWQQKIVIPESSRSKIEGTVKLAYQSRIPGVDPKVFDPDDKFGYKPISIIESDIALQSAMLESDDLEEDESDNEKEKYVEINPVEGGELVDTEFGVGHITRILQNDVWVEIPGLGQVRVPKACVWIITNPVAIKALEVTLRKAPIIYNPPGIKGKNAATVQPVNLTLPQVEEKIIAPIKKLAIKKVDVEEDEAPTDTKKIVTKKPLPPKFDKFDVSEDEENSIYVGAEIIDGRIALTCNVADQDSETLIHDFDFQRINKYYAVQVTTAQGLDRLIEVLRENFNVSEDVISNLEPYGDLIRRGNLAQANPTQFAAFTKFFGLEQKKFIKEGFAKPFPIVWGDSLYVAFDYEKTRSIRDIMRAVRKAVGNGLKSLANPIQDGVHLKFYENADDAIDELQDISKELTVEDLDDTMKFLQGIRKRKVAKKKEEVLKTAVKIEKNPAPVVTRTKPVPQPAIKKVVKKR